MQATKHLLPTGARLITIPQPDSLSTTFLILVEAGSKYESKELSGLSHFLEHMCFKGTTKRPRPLNISSDLDSLGAHYNAFTSQEYTGYYATVEPKMALAALESIKAAPTSGGDGVGVPTPKAVGMEKGVYMIRSQIEDVLKKRGLEKIVIKVGEKFNPAVAEAIVEVESDLPDGAVVEEIEAGYRLYDKIIRPARVKISKNKK